VKTEAGGRLFDSKAEAAHYLRLLAEQRAGRVNNLRCQVRFVLRVNNRKVTTYVADFTAVRCGRLEVIDVKGVLTPAYKIKRALMLAIHGIRIIEVR
jgi:hypothetical protein